MGSSRRFGRGFDYTLRWKRPTYTTGRRMRTGSPDKQTVLRPGMRSGSNITRLVAGFGPDTLNWDQGTSPVLTRDYVVVARMHQGESWLATFDKTSSQMRWKVPRNYETPVEGDHAYHRGGGSRMFMSEKPSRGQLWPVTVCSSERLETRGTADTLL